MKLIPCIGLRRKQDNDMIGGPAIGTYKRLHGHFHLPASRVRKQLGDAAFMPYFFFEGTN